MTKPSRVRIRFLCAAALAAMLAAVIPSAAAEEQSPVSISVDGETVFGSAAPVDAQRKTDVALDKVDIQVKYDGLDVKPILNVSTWPARRSYRPSEEINFLASSNYPAWIASSEIRIFEQGKEGEGSPLYTIAVHPEGSASWTMPANGPAELVYVLRVSDQAGRFDETKPLSLVRTSKEFDQHDPGDKAVAPGYGEDRTAFRNIPVYGGAVTVAGRDVPDGHNVRVLGDSIPVDAEGAFVVQRILPPGDHTVDVAVVSDKDSGLEFSRQINIPTSEWFYVALADITAGARFGSDGIEDIKPGEFDDVYSKGRLAFYVKGKIRGRYLLTAAADTGEGKIPDIFKGLDAKDPRQFLNRIDPDDYYPVYGDNSTVTEDAPTRGKFYVRLERGDSRVMWGNFKTRITGTQFLRNERALYGANAVYRSEKSTEFGERQTELNVYAAQPGTLPQRDIFRGTGGSAYFLKHQDVTSGSETVTLEVRDPATGQVLSRRSLRFGFDYDFDYIQGLVILKLPLASSTGDTGLLEGGDQYLVVNYEFTPVASDADGYVVGGRAQQWLGERVRIGVTAAQEKTGPANQKTYGADVLVRHSDRTFVEAEAAQSKGPGFGNFTSTDGGLTLADTPTSGISGKAAEAYRVKGQVALEEITHGAATGSIGGYFERKQGGFSSLDEQVTSTKRTWGADGRVKLSEQVEAHAKYDDLKSADGKTAREVRGDVAMGFGEHVTVTPVVKHSKKAAAGGMGTDDGARTDFGGVLAYRWDEATEVYVLAQKTVDRSGDRGKGDRTGIGGKMPVTEKVGVSGEVSTGSTGIGAQAGVDYHPTADDHYYLGYRLDPDRENSADVTTALDGDDLGVIVAGGRHRYSERLSAFAEDNYDMFGAHRSLTQTYGVDYTPTATWNVGGALEVGEIDDDAASDFDRVAASLSAAYHGENGLEGRVKGEFRFEDSADDTRDRDSYLLGGALNVQATEDWRLLTSLDVVVSDSSTDSLDGEYVEGSIGYAYRPVKTDRLDALFKYTFLYDYPGIDQVTVDGTTSGPAQLSHIVSADFTYDLSKILTVGAKYGARFGETRDRTAGSPWVKSSTHLAIVRADVNFYDDWDALLEGRVLWNPDIDSTDLGLLVALYRDIGENFKIGVGYNFGRFSDDLTDLTYDDHGVFINAVGKF